MSRKIHILLVIIILFFIRGGVFAETIDKSKVNKVKVGLLYNMAKMITWPEGSFIDDEPVSILFLGKDYNEIGNYFASQVRSRSLTVNGRNISVKQLSQTKLDDVVRNDVKKCHILYIMSSYRDPIMELLRAIGKRPVLVVGDSSRLPLEGGMIGLGIEKKRVSISVNLDAVKNADLKISVQLLQHAKIVKSKNE